MITGKYLIDMGYKPDKTFKAAIEHINTHSLTDDQIREYMDSIKIVHIEPHAQPQPYIVNIRPESDDEAANIDAVISNMDMVMTVPTAVAGAIMPDACPTGPGQIPVGGVVVTHKAIHPAMHSADICCSVMATNFGKVDPKTVLDAAHSVTHFGPGGRVEFSELPQHLSDLIDSNAYLKRFRNLAESHMGTQGDGNHFLFVGVSKISGETVMVTHHGSRGFGANLYKTGMEVAERFRKELSPKTSPKNAWIPSDTPEGERYWDALQIVREWTKTNHLTIHNQTMIGAGLDPGNVRWGVERIWNEHNFVFRDGDAFYHAKGATPLSDKFVPDSANGLRLIPLNMSQPVLVVRGETTDRNLGFAPHGAGRNVSRAAHKSSNSHRTKDEIFEDETAGLDVRFFSGHIDISELPSAYKNADAVKSQISEFGLGEVVDEILPYGCIMAGDWEIDAPWRRK